MTDPDTFEKRWKNHANELGRLRASASGDRFERIGEIQEELEEIIEGVADEFREE